MNTKNGIVRYRNSEFKVENADDIGRYDVMQEHPMILAESKDIGSKVKKGKCQERYSSEVRDPMTFNSEKAEYRVYDIEQGKKYRNEFQEEDDGFVQPLTS